MILYQDCSSHLDSSKKVAARGRGLFSLYIYIEKFKNLLVRNHWTDFNIIWQKCSFGDPLGRLFKPFGWSSFKVVQMVPVHCISRSQELKIDFLTKNSKNLLVRNHWTDFNIILQKCFFGDPLPRLFETFGLVKKTCPPGGGDNFPYISISKTLKIFLSETTGPISI